MRPANTPNLDVRLTRSQSGSILDIDFVGGLDGSGQPAPSPKCANAAASSASSTATALVTSGRKLKIMEHRVHKMEMRVKESGEQEEELVVSNTRPFSLKVGVHDANDRPLLDFSLPLRATLLYENGLPVKQTSSSEPLLVGETDVVALRGTATFRLRITSLSSHRDKRRFRIQVAPQDYELERSEPLLTCVTDPMKSVTKLGRYGRASSSSSAPDAPAPTPPSASDLNSLKRKYREALETHGQQIEQLQATQQTILTELQSVARLVAQSAGGKASS